jgi:chaperonin GroEL
MVEGMQFDRGYFSPILLLIQKNGSRIRILTSFCMTKVSSLKELLPVLEPVAQSGKPLLIIAEDVMEALSTLVVNKLRGALKCCCKSTWFGDDRRKAMLRRYCYFDWGTVISEEKRIYLEKIQLSSIRYC